MRPSCSRRCPMPGQPQPRVSRGRPLAHPSTPTGRPRWSCHQHGGVRHRMFPDGFHRCGCRPETLRGAATGSGHIQRSRSAAEACSPQRHHGSGPDNGAEQRDSVGPRTYGCVAEDRLNDVSTCRDVDDDEPEPGLVRPFGRRSVDVHLPSREAVRSDRQLDSVGRRDVEHEAMVEFRSGRARAGPSSNLPAVNIGFRDLRNRGRVIARLDEREPRRVGCVAPTGIVDVHRRTGQVPATASAAPASATRVR